MRLFLRCLVYGSLLCSSHAFAATYYLANAGNDDNDGLSPATAWASLDKLNNTTLANGDQILFKRGDLFRGKLNPAKTYTGLYYGAYGEGPRPVLSGSLLIKGWQPSALRDGVYEISLANLISADQRIEHLFANGKLQTIARYPNVDSPAQNNWLQVDNEDTDGFIDAALAARGNPDNYWQGATLRIRDYSWTFTVKPITGYDAASGRLAVSGLGKQLPEWGYFIDGKLEELDHPGEWFYQQASQVLFYYPPAGQNPDQMQIEGSFYSQGVTISNHDDDTVVENLVIQHYTGIGLHINSSARVRVQNCHLEHNGIGLTIWNANAALITENTFDHNLQNSITLLAAADFDVEGSQVSSNQILNSSMYSAYGERDDGIYNGIGISLFGHDFIVRENVVKNSSWVGVNIQGQGGHTLAQNVVMNSLMQLNDGGAMIVGSDNNTLSNNLLLYSWGNVDESSNGCSTTTKTPCSKHSTYGMGIGANSKFDNNRIEANTVAHNRDMGIRLNSFNGTKVYNNLVFDNDPGIVLEDYLGPSSANEVIGNRIISLNPNRLGLSMTNNTEHGLIAENYYCNPYNELYVMRNSHRYSLENWQTLFEPLGLNSQRCQLDFPEYLGAELSDNLISNGNFDTDIKGWTPSATLSHDSSQASMDGGSMKVQTPRDGSTLNLIPGSNRSIVEGQWYRLSFSLEASGYGDLRISGNRTQPEYAILHTRYISMRPGRRDYNWYFQAKETTDYFKILFITDEQDPEFYWLDNVSFVPVDAAAINPSSLTRLWLNLSDEVRSFELGDTQYQTLEGQSVSSPLLMQPRSSQVLIYAGGSLPPPTPPSLWLQQNGQTVSAFWNPISDAEGYRLYYAPYPNAEQIYAMDVGQQTELSVDLAPGMAFYVAVSAYNAQGESAYSNIRWFVLQ